MLISGIRAQGIKQHSNSRFNHHSRKSALDKKQRMKKLIDGMEQRVHGPGNKDERHMQHNPGYKDSTNRDEDCKQQTTYYGTNSRREDQEKEQEDWKNTKIKGRKEGKEDHAFFEKRKMKADSKIFGSKIIEKPHCRIREALALSKIYHEMVSWNGSMLQKRKEESSNLELARSSRNPIGGYEGIRRFEDYHGDGNMDGSLAAKEKGRVEHFGITLKEEEEGKHKLMHTSYCQ
ncbi:hypothetical protein Tco_1547762 [Tanacetum coccineum]